LNCFSRKKTYPPGTEEEDGHRRSIRGKRNLKKERKKERGQDGLGSRLSLFKSKTGSGNLGWKWRAIA